MKLNVNVRQTTEWVEGITFANPEFTVAEISGDIHTGFLGTVKAGYKYIVATVELTNTTGKELEVDWSADGYNAMGEKVSNKFYFQPVFTLEHIAPGAPANGRITMTWSEEIKSVTLNTRLIVSAGGPTPASKLYTIVFSKKWLLENDTDPTPNVVSITFSEDWLVNSPPVAVGEETVTLSIPKELFKSHVRSIDAGMITVSLPSAVFIGLPGT